MEAYKADDVRKRIIEKFGDQLTANEVELIVTAYRQVYRAFSFVGLTHEQAVKKMCEMLYPFLTWIWHKSPVCDCQRGRYYAE